NCCAFTRKLPVDLGWCRRATFATIWDSRQPVFCGLICPVTRPTRMALPAAQLDDDQHFLGVERSLTGRAGRNRLDSRDSALALAIAQRHGLDELLARVLAGRNVEVDEVESFLDPTIKN